MLSVVFSHLEKYNIKAHLKMRLWSGLLYKRKDNIKPNTNIRGVLKHGQRLVCFFRRRPRQRSAEGSPLRADSAAVSSGSGQAALLCFNDVLECAMPIGSPLGELLLLGRPRS